MRVRRVGAAIIAAASAMVLSMAPSATAMTDNAHIDDGSEYPSVVALLYVRANDGFVFPYCTGTMITSTVVLTASHCNEGTAEYARSKGYTLGATNDPKFDVVNPDGWVKADDVVVVDLDTGLRTNPLYKGGYRDDVSAQVIDTILPNWDVKGVPQLPRVGLLDDLQKAKTLKDTAVIVVGYGSEAKVTPANTPVTFPDSNQRRYAVLPTLALDKQWIHQDQNVGRNPDQAGACYGDSGGPSIITQGSALVVAGVTSTGDGPCFATNVASRTDTASALDFLYSVAPELKPAR